MPLIVEDGTFPAGANAAVSEPTVDAFAADNLDLPGAVAWAAAVSAAKEAAIRAATRYLAGLLFNGTARGRLPFPRAGCVERGGQAVGEAEIPWRYEEAACMLALRALSGPLHEDAITGVKSVKAGPVEVEMVEGETATTDYTAEMALLGPLLRQDGVLDTAPIFVAAAPVSDAFKPPVY